MSKVGSSLCAYRARGRCSRRFGVRQSGEGSNDFGALKQRGCLLSRPNEEARLILDKVVLLGRTLDEARRYFALDLETPSPAILDVAPRQFFLR